jgi:RHS repeat-associated protein
MVSKRHAGFKSFVAKVLILTLTLTLISYPFSTTGAASNDGPSAVVSQAPSSTESEAEPTSNYTAEYKEKTPADILAKRTETTKTFDNGDGTYTMRLYPGPVHTLENGKWVDLDHNIKSAGNGGFENGKGRFKARFAGNSKSSALTTFEYQDYKVTYSLADASDFGAKSFIKPNSVSPRVNGNSILYPNVYQDVDLRQIVTDDGLKEDLILKKYNGRNTFVFAIKMAGVNAVKEDDGSISFYKKGKGEKIFSMPKPFMVDSSDDSQKGEGIRSDDVTADVVQSGADIYITITADEQWLKDRERKYPVYIDPTTNLNAYQDAFVASAYPSTNYNVSWESSGGYYQLKAGYYDSTTGTNYSLVQVDTSSLAGKLINSASFNIYTAHSYYNTTPTTVWLNTINSSWSASGVTWNNKPASAALTSTSTVKNSWASFNVTSTVAGWASGGGNYGFLLHENGNGQAYWKKFYATENSSNKPYLAVNYSDPPAAPTAGAYGNAANSKSGYVNLSWAQVPGASGYKVLVFNGRDYESWNVGSATSWTSKNKGIWPTPGEIAAGRYALHHDGSGAELADDPHRVYTNAGTTYANRQNYWFRIVAYNSVSESNYSNASMPTLPDRSAPPAVSGVTVTDTNGGQVNPGTSHISVKWTGVADAATGSGYGTSYYKVNLHKTDLASGSTTTQSVNVAHAGGTAHSAAFSNLADNTRYKVDVITYDLNGNYSAPVSSLTWERKSYYAGYVGDIPPLMLTGQAMAVPVTVANTGTVVWPAAGAKPVKLTYHWEDLSGNTVVLDGLRTSLPYDLAPNDVLQLKAEIRPPDAPGKYKLRVDMMEEGAAAPYFKDKAVPTGDVYVTVVDNLSGLGIEEFWQYVTDPFDNNINSANGNLVVEKPVVDLTGRSPFEIDITYNSRSTVSGFFGYGWTSDIDQKLREDSRGNVIYTDPDGTEHIFTKTISDQYVAPQGVYLRLERTSASSFKLTDIKTQKYLTFDKHGTDYKIATAFNQNNNLTVFKYSGDNLVRVSVDSDDPARAIAIQYDTNNRVAGISSPAVNDPETGLSTGIQTRFEYDGNGNLISIIEAAGTAEARTTRYNYDANHNLTAITYPNGNKAVYTYDGSRRVVKVNGSNLINNPDFDNPLEDGSIPGWTMETPSGASLRLDEDSFSGQKAVKLSKPAETESPLRICSSRINTKENSDYLLSFYGKTAGINGESGLQGVLLKGYGANDQEIFTKQVRVDSHDWSRYSIACSSENARYIIIYGLLDRDVSGEMWLDCFQLEEQTGIVPDPGAGWSRLDTEQYQWDAGVKQNLDSGSLPGSVKLAPLSGSVIKTETSQTDFQQGTLTNVTAAPAGDLQLSRAQGWSGKWWNRTSSNYNVIDTTQTPAVSSSHSTVDFTDFIPAGQGTYYNGRLEGLVTPKYNESYTLYVTADDGVRVWFDGALLIDAWQSQAATIYTITTPLLQAGKKYKVVVEHFQGSGAERLAFEWGSLSQPRQIVPAAQVCSNYKASGSRISPVFDISTSSQISGSVISWNSNTPDHTAIKIETSISLDDGATWGAWQTAVNGGAIPGITSATNLSHARLRVRQTLTTSDGTVTPQLLDLFVKILPRYFPSGTWTSPVYDASSAGAFHTGSLDWEADLPSGAAIAAQYRTSADGTAWGPWTAVSKGGSIVYQGYVQYRMVLSASSDSQSSPELRSVSLCYRSDGGGVSDTGVTSYNNALELVYETLSTTVTDPNGSVDRYTHNPFGNVISLSEDVNGRNIKTTYEYNNRFNLIKLTDANGGVYKYVYDNNGNLLNIIKPSGEVVANSFDSQNNITGSTDPFTYIGNFLTNTNFESDANGAGFNNAGFTRNSSAYGQNGAVTGNNTPRYFSDSVASGKNAANSANSYVEKSSAFLARVTDGDLASDNYVGLVSTDGQPVYVTIDLGGVKELSGVIVWHYFADGRTYHKTKTQLSEDGSNWVTIFDSAVSGEYAETPSGKSISLPSPLRARYIRDFTGGNTKNGINHWVEIRAVDSFGQGMLIEEGTSNYVNSDADNDGLSDGWLFTWNRKGVAPALKEVITVNGVPGKVLHIKDTSAPQQSGGCQTVEGWTTLNENLAGQSLTFSFWMWGVWSGTNPGSAYINWYDSNGTFLSQTKKSLAIRSTPSRAVLTAVGPANAYKAYVGIYSVDGLDSGDSYDVYVGGMQLEKKPYATSFVSYGANRASEALTVPTTDLLSTVRGTVEGWVYVNSLVKDQSACRYIFAVSTNAGSPYQNTIALRHRNNGWGFWTVDGSGNASEASVEDTLTEGWHHFAARWSAAESSLFIDGVKVAGMANPKLPSALGSALYLGTWAGGSYGYLNSRIRDFRVSSSYRTDEEILADFSRGRPLPVDAFTTCKMSFDQGLTARRWSLGNWSFTSDSNSSGTGMLTDEAYYHGSRSVSIEKHNRSGSSYFQQTRSVAPGKTYTVSAWVKTKNIDGTADQGARLLVRYKDRSGNWIALPSVSISGSSDWQRISKTFAIPGTASGEIIVRLALSEATGTAWFDAVQLETGGACNAYNMADNNSFEYSVGAIATGWNLTAGSSLEARPVNVSDGQKSLKINHDGADGWRGAVGVQRLPVRPGEELTISGMVKAANFTPDGYQNLFVRFYGSDNTSVIGQDGPAIPQGSYEWLTVAKSLTVPQGAYYADIAIQIKSKVLANVWLDAVQLRYGNISVSYHYDSNNNRKETAHQPSDLVSFEYDRYGNVIKKILMQNADSLVPNSSFELIAGSLPLDWQLTNPLQTGVTVAVDNNAGAAFYRSTAAYRIDGARVAADQPRYEQGRFGQALTVEEGAANLINTQGGGANSDWAKWTHWGNRTYWSSETQNSDPIYGNVYAGVNANSTATYLFDYYPYTVAQGAPYTISVALRASQNWSGGTAGYITRGADNGTIGSTVKNISLTKTWQRFDWVVTPNQSQSGTAGMGIRFSGLPAGVTLYAARPQFEQSAYATSYTDSNRSGESLAIPSSIFNPSQGTIEAWVKSFRNSGGSIQMIADVGGTGHTGLILSLRPNGKFSIQAGTGSAVLQATSTTAAAANTWYYVAGKWDASGIAVYVNGVKEGFASGTPVITLAGPPALGREAQSAERWFDGLIDDFRVSSRARTDEEIIAAYKSSQPLTVDGATTYKLGMDGNLLSTGDYAGKNTLKISAADNIPLADYGVAGDYLDVAPNAIYTLSALMNGKDIKDGKGAFLQVQFFNNRFSYMGEIEAKPFSDSFEWRKQILNFQTPAEAVKIKVSLILNAHGSVWMDQIQLNRGIVVTDNNSLQNAGAENGNLNAPSLWTKGITSGNPLLTGAADIAKEGLRSLKISSSELADADWRQAVRVKPNTRYTFTGWVKTEGLISIDAKVFGTYYILESGSESAFDSNITAYHRNLGNNGFTNDWKLITYTFVTRPNTTVLRIGASLGSWGKAVGKAWFDALCLHEGGEVYGYGYDHFGNYLTSITDPKGITTTAVYDPAGNKIKETDARGNSIVYTYDLFNRLIKETDALGNSIRYAYDVNGNMTSQTDAQGNTTAYIYDAFDRLVKVIDPQGSSLVYNYDASNNKIRFIDANGNVYRYKYDGLMRLTSQIDPLGNKTGYDYDALGNLIAVTDPLGYLTAYSYDIVNRLIRATDPLGNAVGYTYSPEGNVTSSTDALGNKITYTYDSNGRLFQKTDALGYTTGCIYDLAERVVLITDPQGNPAYSVYDSVGNLIQEIDALGNLSSFSYDVNGNRLTAKDPLGNITSYEYDALNRLVRSTDPLNGITDYTYDANGNQSSITDPNRNTVTYIYDALNRLIKIIEPLGKITQSAYDANGNRISVTDPNNNKTVYTYDQLNRLIAVSDPENGRTSYVYDGNGNTISVTVKIDDLRNATTAYVYDPLNRVISKTSPLGETTRYTYDANGNLLTVKDPLNNVTFYSYDSRNQVITVTDPLGNTTTRTYDGNGNILTEKDALNKITAYSYDALNRLTAIADPLNNRTRYEYDGNGNRTAVIDAEGGRTSYTYDALNRLTTSTNQIGDTKSYQYDACGNLITYTDGEDNSIDYDYDQLNRQIRADYPDSASLTYSYDKAGNLLGMTDSSGTTTYAYDKLNRLVKEINPELKQNTYTYDRAGNVIRKNLDGTIQNFTYDLDNRLTGVSRNGSPAVAYTYDLSGNLLKEEYAGGVSTNYTYNQRNQITEVKTLDSLHNVISHITYNYDALGRKTGETDQKTGKTTNYAYNDLGWLLSVAAPTGQTTYSYDKNGNLVSKTDAAGTVNYVNNRANQLISMSDPAGKVTTFSYDRNGNLITKTEGTNNTVYQYNFDGKLIKVTNADGGTTSYTYDGNGRRVSKTSQGETIKYYYDGQLAVKETDANGAALAEYLYGINGSPVSITTGGKTYNYIYNSRGDTIALTSTAGTIAAAYSYNPWGAVSGTGEIANPFQYVGRYGVIHDRETGLDLMGLRYYNANISRFITPDQFPGLITEPVTHNLYIYCNADPINNIDPTGQLAIGGWIKKAGKAIKKAVKKAVKKVKQVVKKAVTTVKKVVKQTAKKAAATVKKTAKQVKKTVTTTVKSAVKTVSKAAAKVTQQIKTAVTDKGTASSPRAPPTKILDAVQTGLDIAGLVPGVGEIADGTNALIYTLRGDKTNAALSAAACIPFAGWGAAGIKIANKGVKALDKAGDVYDVGRMAGKATSKASSIEGQTVYRVWGGEPSVPELKSSGPWGSSWTPVNPATVSNYRNAAGLPTLGGQSGVANTGRFVSVGRVIDPSGVKIRDAIALDGNTGGLPEYLFLNPPSQIELIGVYGVNPPF